MLQRLFDMLERFEFFISSMFAVPDVARLLPLDFYVVYPFVADRALYSTVQLYDSISHRERVFCLVETVFQIFPNRYMMVK